MKIYRFLFVLAAISFPLTAVRAQSQQPPTPEQQEKQIMEFVDKEVQRLSSLLDLEYWQEFYVDSTLTHDFRAMNAELQGLQQARVENTDLYVAVQDKWMQQIDNTYKKYFNEEQWARYWKSGGRRAQEARDKRKQKKK